MHTFTLVHWELLAPYRFLRGPIIHTIRCAGFLLSLLTASAQESATQYVPGVLQVWSHQPSVEQLLRHMQSVYRMPCHLILYTLEHVVQSRAFSARQEQMYVCWLRGPYYSMITCFMFRTGKPHCQGSALPARARPTLAA